MDARRVGASPYLLVALAVATAVVATLALAARADAYVYWASLPPKAFVPSPGVERANLDGTGTEGLIPAAQPLFGVYGVAVDNAHVYWTNPSQTIGRANLEGTGVNQSFIAGTTGLTGVAVDDAHVYWASDAGIGRANLDGTGVNQSFIASAGDPIGVAVDGAHVYWTNRDAGTIGRANLDGTGVNQSFIAGANSFFGLAVDAAHIYWASGGGIGRANLDGTAPELGFIDGVDPVGLAVDGAHVYWSSSAAIGRANLDGTDVAAKLIGVSPMPYGVAVDTLGPPPSSEFSFGKAKVNKKRGSAKLTVKVAGPGELKLAKTASVKGQHERAEQSGKESLTIKPRGKAKQKLKQGGKAKLKAKVSFTPDGGTSDTQSKKIKLVKR
jgi:virginiamycin B lyase